MRKSFMLLVLLCSVMLASISTAKDLVVGVGTFEPFFIRDGNRGLFLDLTKEIFKLLPKYNVEYKFMPNKRLAAMVASGKIDAACNIFEGSNVSAHLSSPLFRFQDVAITIKHKEIIINNVSDLKGLKVAAYQGATDLLGAEYASIMAGNPWYGEYADQSRSIRMLIAGRSDVRVGDIFIFLNDLNNLRKDGGDLKFEDFNVHRIWDDVFSHMAFKDKIVRDEVNDAIQKIKDNGAFDKVYKKYEKYLKEI